MQYPGFFRKKGSDTFGAFDKRPEQQSSHAPGIDTQITFPLFRCANFSMIYIYIFNIIYKMSILL
jgi:hypothetical protein